MNAKGSQYLGKGTALFLVLLSYACATKYRPLKSGTGYASAQVHSNEFTVGFHGNADTSLERAYDFALLRSAEIARQNNFRFFSVLDVTNTSSAKRYTRVYRTLSAPVPGAQDFGWYECLPEPYTVEVQQPQIYFQPGTVFFIRCFTDRPGKQFAYDAADLEESLRRKYRLR